MKHQVYQPTFGALHVLQMPPGLELCTGLWASKIALSCIHCQHETLQSGWQQRMLYLTFNLSMAFVFVWTVRTRLLVYLVAHLQQARPAPLMSSHPRRYLSHPRRRRRR
jgi:hypothetical protein